LDPTGELSDPIVYLVRAEPFETGDGGVLVRAEPDPDRTAAARSAPTSSEDDLDQASADPAVAVPEGVDRLQRSGSEPRLRARRHVVAVQESAEAVQERTILLPWWPDEFRPGW